MSKKCIIFDPVFNRESYTLDQSSKCDDAFRGGVVFNPPTTPPRNSSSCHRPQKQNYICTVPSYILLSANHCSRQPTNPSFISFLLSSPWDYRHHHQWNHHLRRSAVPTPSHGRFPTGKRIPTGGSITTTAAVATRHVSFAWCSTSKIDRN